MTKWLSENSITSKRRYQQYNFGKLNELLQYRHQKLPRLYRKKDWQRKYKEPVYQKYNSLPAFNECHTEKKDNLPVILMVHVTSEEVAFGIVTSGFGTVSSLDTGYYGQGIYFTRSINYATSFVNWNGTAITLILSLVTPGNVYPHDPLVFNDAGTKVTNESLSGKPIKPGYQSHYALVDRKGDLLPPYKLEDAVYDELVVPQDSQAVARYIIKVVPHTKKRRQTSKSKKFDKKTKKEKGDNEQTEDQASEVDTDGLAGELSDDELSDAEDDTFISSRELW